MISLAQDDDFDQLSHPFLPQVDVFDRDFKDEFERTDLKKLYKLQIKERDDFHLNSFSQVHVSIELVYPPDFLANATITVSFSFLDETINTTRLLFSYYRIKDLKDIKLPPWTLQNYQKSLILIDVQNNEKENIVIEVKISKSKYYLNLNLETSIPAIMGFGLSIVIFIFGPNLRFKADYIPCVLLSWVFGYKILSTDFIYSKFASMISIVISFAITLILTKKKETFNTELMWERYQYIFQFANDHQNTVLIVSNCILSLFVGAILQDYFFQISRRNNARERIIPLSNFILFFILGFLLIYFSINASLSTILFISLSMMIFPYLMNRI